MYVLVLVVYDPYETHKVYILEENPQLPDEVAFEEMDNVLENTHSLFVCEFRGDYFDTPHECDIYVQENGRFVRFE